MPHAGPTNEERKLKLQVHRDAILTYCVISLAIISSQHADAASTYDVTNIGALSGASSSYARSINNHGDVVGYVDAGSQATTFLYNASTGYTSLGSVIGSGYYGTTINDSGDIAGLYGSLNNAASGFIYNGGTKYSIAPATGLANSYHVYTISEINSSGVVVGTTSSDSMGNYRAGFISASGVWTLLPSLGGNPAYGRGINDVGIVVGYSSNGTNVKAAKWTLESNNAWSVADLGTLGGPTSAAYDINNNNITVGASRISNGNQNGHAALWKADGTIVDLGNLESGSIPSYAIAYAINDHNVAVGYSGTDTGITHACVWTADSNGNYVLADLNTLIDSSSGWVLNIAYDINDAGQIVGVGTYQGVENTAFVLNFATVPEPASLAMLGLAAGGLMFRRRR